MSEKHQTQAERRSETRSKILESACRHFGEKGYNNTSLSEIAADCGITKRPIFYYFSNKQMLFFSVAEVMDERILSGLKNTNEITAETLLGQWCRFLTLCDDPGFRRIVLIDSPNVLGRKRWVTSPIATKAQKLLSGLTGDSSAEQFRTALQIRMITVALAEAALMVAEADDIKLAKRESELQVRQILEKLFDKT